MKRKYAIALAVVLIVVTTAAALTWMWLSNTIEDDVEVTDRPMTLTLLQSPDGIWKGTWTTWTFNLSVDSGVWTGLYYWVSISWAEYNSSEDYIGLSLIDVGGCVCQYTPDCLRVGFDIQGPEGEPGYQWQAGNSTSFTFDILIDIQMPIGMYHFEFIVGGYMV